MTEKIYISSSACLSAQHTFENTEGHRIETIDTFKVTDPDYKQFIDTGALRRMNRINKFSLAVASKCLQNYHGKIDAIITATGWGCIESTYKFLERLFDEKGLPVNPVAFIQSTHNTMAAQIALKLKSHVYNNTITDNQSAFELALDDAILNLHENHINNVLLGGCDEITEPLEDILKRVAMFGHPVPLGEGCTYFILSKNNTGNIATIKAFETTAENKFTDMFNKLANEHAVDYVFVQNDDILSELSQVNYTTYFGNFPTVSACGLWLAVYCLNNLVQNIASHAQNIMLVSKSKPGICYFTVVGK